MKKLGYLVAMMASVGVAQNAMAYDYFHTDGSFKRFSVSAGWLHAMPQGKANNMQNTTTVDSNTSYKNGQTSVADIQPILVDQAKRDTLNGLIGAPGLDPIPAEFAGTSKISSLGSWESANTGLEADNADTLGLLFNYYVNDNVSLELKAGIPPKVDIKGKGTVYSPIQGTVYPEGLGATVLGAEANIDTNIQITDMNQGNGVASTAKAWLPAIEAHYQFGKSGVNKFRPYVGAGLMYAHFTDLEVNKGVESDLKVAAHRIQSILNDKAGSGLATKAAILSSPDYNANNYKLDVKATDALAPIVTLGATYDFNDRFYGVGSVSYSKLNNKSVITVKNSQTGQELLRSSTKIDIDPIITYLGVGYRF